jgi:hypothetical protein
MAYQQPKYVYIVEFTDGIKFGITSNLEQRLNSYKLAWNKPIVSQWYIKCKWPKIVERQMKYYFKKNIVTPSSKEFVTNIPIQVVVNFLQSHFKVNKVKKIT